MSEVPLPGGAVNQVVRVGDTVRRPAGARAAFVHELLDHLDGRGWGGAPRFLGVDDLGREVLEFVPGQVAWEPEHLPSVRRPGALVGVVRLVRQLHDLTAGTALAGDRPVVCHNDLAPKNTVYRGDDGHELRPVAFLDWDLAAPGERVHDVAHVCWQYVGLGPGCTDAGEAAHLVRLAADAYGLTEDRHRLVDTVLWWQDRCLRGIEAAAAAGDPAMVRLRDGGAMRAVGADFAWVTEHRRTLEAAL